MEKMTVISYAGSIRGLMKNLINLQERFPNQTLIQVRDVTGLLKESELNEAGEMIMCQAHAKYSKGQCEGTKKPIMRKKNA